MQTKDAQIAVLRAALEEILIDLDAPRVFRWGVSDYRGKIDAWQHEARQALMQIKRPSGAKPTGMNPNPDEHIWWIESPLTDQSVQEDTMSNQPQAHDSATMAQVRAETNVAVQRIADLAATALATSDQHARRTILTQIAHATHDARIANRGGYDHQPPSVDELFGTSDPQ